MAMEILFYILEKSEIEILSMKMCGNLVYVTHQSAEQQEQQQQSHSS